MNKNKNQSCDSRNGNSAILSNGISSTLPFSTQNTRSARSAKKRLKDIQKIYFSLDNSDKSSI